MVGKFGYGSSAAIFWSNVGWRFNREVESLALVHQQVQGLKVVV